MLSGIEIFKFLVSDHFKQFKFDDVIPISRINSKNKSIASLEYYGVKI